MKIRFSSTWSGARVETKYGCIFEKAPLVGHIYELNMQNDGALLFKNLTQPHHTIMWWLEYRDGRHFFGGSALLPDSGSAGFSGSTAFSGSEAFFEILGE